MSRLFPGALALLLIGIITPSAAQVNIPISQLPRATLPLSGESVPLTQSGTTKQAPVYAFAIPVFSSASPSTPITGQQWFNTSSAPWVDSVWDGVEWDALGSIDPTGHTWDSYCGGSPCGSGGGGGAPGGSSGQIQYNNNGTFAGVTIVPATNGGAGAVNGALKGNGSGYVSQAACADLSNAGTFCNGTNAASLTGIAPNSVIPTPTTSALGGVQAASTATVHNWIDYIPTTGVAHVSQPTSTDLADEPPCAAMTATGSLSTACKTIACAPASGNITLTVPAGSGLNDGKGFNIPFYGAAGSTCTIQMSGSDKWHNQAAWTMNTPYGQEINMRWSAGNSTWY